MKFSFNDFLSKDCFNSLFYIWVRLYEIFFLFFFLYELFLFWTGINSVFSDRFGVDYCDDDNDDAGNCDEMQASQKFCLVFLKYSYYRITRFSRKPISRVKFSISLHDGEK